MSVDDCPLCDGGCAGADLVREWVVTAGRLVRPGGAGGWFGCSRGGFEGDLVAEGLEGLDVSAGDSGWVEVAFVVVDAEVLEPAVGFVE